MPFFLGGVHEAMAILDGVHAEVMLSGSFGGCVKGLMNHGWFDYVYVVNMFDVPWAGNPPAGYVSNLLKSVLVLFDYHKVTVWLRDGFRPKLPGSMGRFQWFAVGFGPFFRGRAWFFPT